MKAASTTSPGNAREWYLPPLLERIFEGQRVLPDFIIIGAAKCGTTALYDYICCHPAVKPAAKKEVQFFDFNYQKGIEWYKSFFSKQFMLGKRRWITGEATPYYLRSPNAASRIRQVSEAYAWNPLFIVLFRNPTARAYSHYQMSRRQYDVEDLPFDEALAAEGRRLIEGATAAEDISDILFSYVGSSIYA